MGSATNHPLVTCKYEGKFMADLRDACSGLRVLAKRGGTGSPTASRSTTPKEINGKSTSDSAFKKPLGKAFGQPLHTNYP